MNETEIRFPLELSDFEYYSYRDDSIDYPMVISFRTYLEGNVDVAAFENSLQAALHHHPLLRCVIQQTGREFKWLPISNPQPVLHCTSHDGADVPDDCPLVRIDLTHEPGARFELRSGPERSVLIAWFHHACVDGLGAIRFLADVFSEYGKRTATVRSDCPFRAIPDSSLLHQRGRCPKQVESFGKEKDWKEWLKGPSRFLLSRSYCISGNNSTKNRLDDSQNILHTAVLPRATLLRLKSLSVAKQVTTNDVCMVAFLQQIHEWTRFTMDATANDLFRILMPVSMRTPDLEAISAANVLSYVFHSFRRNECLSPESLLKVIHIRTADMIHGNEGAVLLKLLSMVRRVPGLFQMSRWLQPAFATAVLTNVGDLKRIFGHGFPLKKGRVVAGNIVIQRIDGTGPLRKNTNVALCTGVYGGELVLNLRFNPETFSSDDATLFQSQFVNRMTHMADSDLLPMASRPVPKPSTVKELV